MKHDMFTGAMALRCILVLVRVTVWLSVVVGVGV